MKIEITKNDLYKTYPEEDKKDVLIELTKDEYVKRIRHALIDFFGGGNSIYDFQGMGDFARGIAWQYLIGEKRVDRELFRKRKEELLDKFKNKHIKEIAQINAKDFETEYKKQYKTIFKIGKLQLTVKL